MHNSLKIFIVNLEKDKERRESIEKQFTNQGINFSFFKGTYGASLTKKELDTVYDRKKTYRNLCSTLVPAHIGCSLSHARLYKHIIDKALPFAIIFEDDIIIPDNLNSYLRNIVKSLDLSKPEVILLSPAKGKGEIIRNISTETYLRKYKSGYFTSSYIVTNLAAKAMYKEVYPINNVADCWRKFVKYKTIDLYVLNSNFIEQDQETFGSSTNEDTWKLNPQNFIKKSWFKFCRAFWLFIDIFISIYKRYTHPYNDVLK